MRWVDGASAVSSERKLRSLPSEAELMWKRLQNPPHARSQEHISKTPKMGSQMTDSLPPTQATPRRPPHAVPGSWADPPDDSHAPPNSLHVRGNGMGSNPSDLIKEFMDKISSSFPVGHATRVPLCPCASLLNRGAPGARGWVPMPAGPSPLVCVAWASAAYFSDWPADPWCPGHGFFRGGAWGCDQLHRLRGRDGF